MYKGKGIAKLTDPVFPLSTRRRHRQKKAEKKDLQLGEGPRGRLARLRRARRPRRTRLRGVFKDFFKFVYLFSGSVLGCFGLRFGVFWGLLWGVSGRVLPQNNVDSLCVNTLANYSYGSYLESPNFEVC